MRRQKLIAPFFILILAAGLSASCGGDLTGVKSGRFSQPIVFKVNAGSAPVRQYASVMQNQLRQAGIPVEIETVEWNTLLDQQRKGQFQLTTGRWVGGNQDPIYLKDLFRTGAYQNRGRYTNPELDRVLDEAFTTLDREKTKTLYAQAQDIISREMPQFPLWYPDQMVVARRNVGNIKVDMSGDWGFIKDLTVQGGKQGPFVTVLESPPNTLDQLRGTDASSERLRQLMYNSLVKKNEKFDYVGDLASNIQTSDDGLTYTFILRDGVKFHDGRALTSADAKYTIETLLTSDSSKANDFFEGTGPGKQPFIQSIDAPDARTLVIRLHKPLAKLLSGLVSFGIMPQNSATDEQKKRPNGSGPFKFVRYDEAQQTADLAANENYWGGAPAIKQLRVRTILDSNTLQAELRSGGVDLAVVANLQPDAYKALAQDANLKVEQFPGANVVYLNFNTQSEPLNDPRVRQAIAHAIDRESIVRDLLLGQARVAHSILPQESWAYSPGRQYTYDPEKAKKILEEAGYKGGN